MARKIKKPANASATESRSSQQKPSRKPGNNQGKHNQTNNSTAEATNNSSKVSSTIRGINDFSWYNNNPLLTEATARIPFPYKPGMAVKYAEDVNKLLTDGLIQGDLKHRIPGVLAINWTPTIGTGVSPTDPASLIAKELYAKVRSKFSGSLDADGPDFVIYLLALDSIYSYIGSLKRLYRVLDAYNPNNYTVPGDILTAYNIPSEMVTGLRASKDILWSNINTLIAMTRKFICPDVMPLFNRHYWMNDNVYADAPRAGSQLYIFIQSGFLKFKLFELTAETRAGVFVGGLEMVKAPHTEVSRNPQDFLRQLYEFGRSLIDALAASDDAYTISGYLQRAFEGSNMFAVAELQQNEPFEPMYVPEVLMQIENATSINFDGSLNSLFATGAFNVLQNPTNNTVGQQLAIAKDTANLTSFKTFMSKVFYPTPMINIRSEVPTVPEVVEATRLSCYVLDAGSEFRFLCSTECVLNFVVCYPNEDMAVGGANGYRLNTAFPTALIDFNPTAILATISKFDWHPRLVITEEFDSGETKMYASNTLWDYYNVTAFSYEQLFQINRVCLLSELGVFS